MRRQKWNGEEIIFRIKSEESLNHNSFTYKWIRVYAEKKNWLCISQANQRAFKVHVCEI